MNISFNTVKLTTFGLGILFAMNTSAQSLANGNSHPIDQIGAKAVTVQSAQGKGDVQALFSKLGLFDETTSLNDKSSTLRDADQNVSATYSHTVDYKEFETSHQNSTSPQSPLPGDTVVYSWSSNGWIYSKTYIYTNDETATKWDLRKTSKDKVNPLDAVYTATVPIQGVVGQLGQRDVFTQQMPGQIVNIYGVSSTVSGYISESGIGSNILVVTVTPNGIVGRPYSGTVTSTVIYR